MKALKCSKCDWIVRPNDINFYESICERCNATLHPTHDLIWIEDPNALLDRSDLEKIGSRLDGILSAILGLFYRHGNTMTKKQKASVWVGVLLFIASGLFPPWASVERYGDRVQVPGGYYWLFAPPTSSKVAEVIDLRRLLVEWAMCAAFAAGLYFAWPTLDLSWKRVSRVGHGFLIATTFSVLLAGGGAVILLLFKAHNWWGAGAASILGIGIMRVIAKEFWSNRKASASQQTQN